MNTKPGDSNIAMPEFMVECEYTDCAWYREGLNTQIDALVKLLDFHIKTKHSPVRKHQNYDSSSSYARVSPTPPSGEGGDR